MTELIARLDNGTEVVMDDIGEDVSVMELCFRLMGVIYRVQSGELEVGEEFMLGEART